MFLVDVMVDAEPFKPVVAASSAGEAGGADKGVVGQDRRWQAVAVACCLQGFDDGVAAHGQVRGDG